MRQITIGLNQIIAAETAAHHATLVDLFSLVDNLYAKGYKIATRP